MEAFAVAPRDLVRDEVKSSIFLMAWLLANVASRTDEGMGFCCLWEGTLDGSAYDMRLPTYTTQIPIVDLLPFSERFADTFNHAPRKFAPEELLLIDGHGPPPYEHLDGFRARAALVGLLGLLVKDAEDLVESEDFNWGPDDDADEEAWKEWDERFHPEQMIIRSRELLASAKQLMAATEVLQS